MIRGARTPEAGAETCCMAVVSHLPYDARVWKEAETIAAAGIPVHLIGMRYGVRRAMRTESSLVTAMELPFGSREGIGTPVSRLQRGAAVIRLWLEVLRAPATVYHCHNIHPAPAVLLAAGLRRARIVYDAHELYGHVPPGATLRQRAGGRLKRLLERAIARRAHAVVTTNPSRATVLERRHGIEGVIVVRNVPAALSASPRDLGVPAHRRVLLYQGGIYARARAFEATIAALRELPEFDFVVIGFGRDDDLALLRRWAADAGVGDRVHLRPPLAFDELIGTAAAATVGLVPLRAISTNSLLGDTNKLFEYLMGGLPVVGSDFPEVRRVLHEGDPPVGEVFDPEQPSSIAAAVHAVVGERYEERRREARRLALEQHNWELEQDRLLRAYGSVRDEHPSVQTSK